MNLLVVNAREVRELLPMAECIDVMASALAALARGEAVQPLRTVVRLPDRGRLCGVMPAFVGGIDAHGVKVVSVFPDNRAAGLDPHQGAVLLFEGVHGCPVAVLDGAEVTAIRTAAVSGVATRTLGRADARSLAILGAGVQARTHLEAMLEVRPFRRVVVWSRERDRARAFVAREAAARSEVCIEAAASARAAVEGADVVCTTTAAREPVLHGAWLQPGTHINAVGACVPTARELDTEAVLRARLFADRRESLLHEAGDFLIPRAQGLVGDDHIAGELGDVLIGRVDGRRTDAEITLFESLGIGVEDVAAAQWAFDAARRRGLGTAVPFGEGPDAAD